MTSRSATPLKPIKVVIEDARLAAGGVRISAPGSVEICVCSGPSSEDEICPLVTDGDCPFGDCDVVVSSLEGPWARAILTAWERAGVAVVDPQPTSPPDREPTVESQLGSAYQALFRAAVAGDITAAEVFGVPVFFGTALGDAADPT